VAVVNPNKSGRKLSDYKWGKGFPTRENCDLDDPREMYLWCLVALPGMNGGPLILPVEYLMMMSEHIFETAGPVKCEHCGHVHDPVKKYRPPSSQEPNWATSPGRWVDAKEPDPPRQPAKEVWGDLHMLQKAELVDAIFNDDRFWERLPMPHKEKLRRVLSDPT
jgi:Protein of unknown function (DUF2744)